MSEILITAKVSPDIDGVACMFAYAQLLGKDVQSVVFGNLNPEAKYFVDKHGVNIDTINDDGSGNWEKVVLVDASSMKGMPKVVTASKVIEIIDHRVGDFKEGEFPNAKVQNEMVGAAATLIVEKFVQADMLPTEANAKLLYGAMFENTLDLNASNVGERDIKAIKFLEDNFGLKHKLVEEMFKFSYQSRLNNLKKYLEEDSKVFELKLGKCAILQMICWGEEIKSHQVEIDQVLQKLQENLGASWGFLSAIDLASKTNYLYCSNIDGQKALSGALNLEFTDNWATLDKLLLRKQIVPLLKS